MEDLQFVLGEGPCIDAFAARRPVLIPDLDHGARCRRLGVLEIFRTRPGSLTTEELSQALTFAEVALTALLGGPDLPASAGTGLDEAMDSFRSVHAFPLRPRRVVIEQAKGAIAQVHGVNVDQAFIMMRGYARRTNRRLSDVARSVVTDPAGIPELANP
ncbi:MAG TPA: ANTAR domain-containing protein [Pseudonocardiaceae bacterium]|nr:ANTAR domain-containing protein [Pseudonocardiaceae bacterium]